MDIQEQIVEWNGVIAKFDGWRKREDFVNGDDKIFPWWEKIENGKVVKTYHHDILSANGRFEYGSYHSSWDWLMPVCKKFDQLPNHFDDYLKYEIHCDEIDNAVTRYEILDAFKTLVLAINWYNTYNTQK